MTELLVLMGGRIMGRVSADATGQPAFNYDATWRTNAAAVPLSLSLPLDAHRHDSDAIAAMLWGLLPDNEVTLDRWARRFQVSARNPLGLLMHVGEDCAGAVQFTRPEELDRVLAGERDNIRWLDDRDMEARLRHLRGDRSAARESGDEGQFSLAGAQAKTALYFDRDEQRWGVPGGRLPTSHILKPPSGEFAGYAENEHFCLRLAHEVGLSVASSRVLRFGDEIAICVERYDRAQTAGGLQRIHQEDFCQALGVHPARKYQNDGGPSPSDLAAVLRRHSSNPGDIDSLYLALAFNWFIAGTDAHAKNYSLLLGSSGEARLAPLYDISSVHPYPALNMHKIKLAMKVGSHYRWFEVTPQDWRGTAHQMNMDAEQADFMLTRLVAELPDIALTQARTLAGEGVEHPVVMLIVDGIARAAQRMRGLLDASA